MNIQALFDGLSSGQVSALIGLLIGLVFGIFAQQSRFCLRAACVEFWRGQIDKKFVIWLLTFGAALLLTQCFIEAGLIDTGMIRQLNNVGSMSGAIIGGLMFGSGMVLSGGVRQSPACVVCYRQHAHAGCRIGRHRRCAGFFTWRPVAAA